MRIQFMGPIVRLEPLALIWTADGTFSKGLYVADGYNRFDVICIGGGGGKAGFADGTDSEFPEIQIRSFGGQGGGGGLHRVRGLLSALGSSESIVVGGAGTDGTNGTGPTPLTGVSNGTDGGPSQFGALAAASGGKGGLKPETFSTILSPGSDGGEGGQAEATTAGGGAAGGVCGTLGPFTAGLPGDDGTYNAGKGEGGGGGAGGMGKYTGITQLPATKGGRGSYNPGDLSVYGPAGNVGNDTVAAFIVPGIASGARVYPFNRSDIVYGQSGKQGVVALLLTKE
jgi:hypothetical protein